MTTTCCLTDIAQQPPLGGYPPIAAADDCVDTLDFCACTPWLDHSTGADHRSRAFQITPSVALSLSLQLGTSALGAAMEPGDPRTWVDVRLENMNRDAKRAAARRAGSRARRTGDIRGKLRSGVSMQTPFVPWLSSALLATDSVQTVALHLPLLAFDRQQGRRRKQARKGRRRVRGPASLGAVRHRFPHQHSRRRERDGKKFHRSLQHKDPIPSEIGESESDNATEGVIWKARDLWSAPVEWSSHGMQAQKPSESMQSSAATTGWHPPSGGCCAISVRQHSVVKGCSAA